MELSKYQKPYINTGCPECGGSLHEVAGIGEDEDEVYLWCDSCLVSIDMNGGYTN